MAYETVRYDVKDAVATITLDRALAYNALNLLLGRDLFHATLEADEDRAVRCIVITGAGKAFCAGGDVKDFNDSPDRIGILIKELTTYLHGAVSRLCRTAKPVVMAVNGVAAGGGMSLALAGDLVVAAESAKFTMAYSRIGASPDGSSSYWLPRLVGVRRAVEMSEAAAREHSGGVQTWGPLIHNPQVVGRLEEAGVAVTDTRPRPFGRVRTPCRHRFSRPGAEGALCSGVFKASQSEVPGAAVSKPWYRRTASRVGSAWIISTICRAKAVAKRRK